MSNKRYSDKELGKKYGYRKEGTPIFAPQELGYRCPSGHANICWSEFRDHIWCYECKQDYHYAMDCFLVKDKFNPKDLPEQPIIISGIKNWTKDGESWNDVPDHLLLKILEEKNAD